MTVKPIFSVSVAMLAFPSLGLFPARPISAAPLVKGVKETPHPIATIQTAKGTIKIKLFPEEAPKTVANFIKLANSGFYNGTTFHRVEPGFVIQGGDPLSKKLEPGDPQIGSGGPGYDIKNEANKMLKHNVGAVAMANAGRDTAGSQFYIVITKPAPFLDEKHEDGVNKYTLFGQVLSGQDVAEKIAVGDKMIKVSVTTPKATGKPAPKPASAKAPAKMEKK